MVRIKGQWVLTCYCSTRVENCKGGSINLQRTGTFSNRNLSQLSGSHTSWATSDSIRQGNCRPHICQVIWDGCHTRQFTSMKKDSKKEKPAPKFHKSRRLDFRLLVISTSVIPRNFSWNLTVQVRNFTRKTLIIKDVRTDSSSQINWRMTEWGCIDKQSPKTIPFSI